MGSSASSIGRPAASSSVNPSAGVDEGKARLTMTPGPLRPTSLPVKPGRASGGAVGRALDNVGIDSPPSGLGAVLQITSWWQLGNQAGINVHHYVVSDRGQGTITLRDIARLWGTQNFDLMVPLVSNAGIYDATGVREKTPQASPQFWESGGFGTGTAGPSPAPEALCGLIRKMTALAARGNHGRTYTPFPPLTALVNGNAIEAAYKAKLDTFAAFLGAVATITKGPDVMQLVPCLLSRSPSHPGRVTDVNGAQALPIWAVQRRRGSFGRQNLPPF